MIFCTEMIVFLRYVTHVIQEASLPISGKDSKPDSWFLFDSYKRKRNPVTKVQEPVPEMSHISPQTYKILHKNAEKHLLV